MENVPSHYFLFFSSGANFGQQTWSARWPGETTYFVSCIMYLFFPTRIEHWFKKKEGSYNIKKKNILFIPKLIKVHTYLLNRSINIYFRFIYSYTARVMLYLYIARVTWLLTCHIWCMLFGVLYVLYLFWCLWPNHLWRMFLVSLFYFCHLVQILVNKPGRGETTCFVSCIMYFFFPTWIEHWLTKKQRFIQH